MKAPLEQNLNPSLSLQDANQCLNLGTLRDWWKQLLGKEKTFICYSISPESRYEEAQCDGNSKKDKNAGYFLMKDPYVCIFFAISVCLVEWCQVTQTPLCRQHLPLLQWFRILMPHSCISNHKNRSLDPGLSRGQRYQVRSAQYLY